MTHVSLDGAAFKWRGVLTACLFFMILQKDMIFVFQNMWAEDNHWLTEFVYT